MKTTPKDIAKWMLKKLKQEGDLYQSVIVYEIEDEFGEKFTYANDNGNLAINKDILEEFRKLTEKTVVWERRGRYWRFRDANDDPNKRQAE